MGGGGGGGCRCCRRPQNEQICLPQNTDFYETVPKATDLIFGGAVDLQKMYVEVRRLTLLCRKKNQKKNQESFPNFLLNISLLS